LLTPDALRRLKTWGIALAFERYTPLLPENLDRGWYRPGFGVSPAWPPRIPARNGQLASK
jgi:hypothetical protein